MTRIYEISDQLVEKIAALHPIAATSLGVPGYEKELERTKTELQQAYGVKVDIMGPG